MEHSVYPYGSNSGAGKAAEEYPPQAVSQGISIAPLKRLDYELAIAGVFIGKEFLDYRPFNFNHSVYLPNQMLTLTVRGSIT